MNTQQTCTCNIALKIICGMCVVYRRRPCNLLLICFFFCFGFFFLHSIYHFASESSNTPSCMAPKTQAVLYVCLSLSASFSLLGLRMLFSFLFFFSVLNMHGVYRKSAINKNNCRKRNTTTKTNMPTKRIK